MNLVGDPYYTDGLRAVMFLEPRPFTLGDIDLLDWERPASARSGYQQGLIGGQDEGDEQR
jgi:hypothetical protein